MYKNWRKVVEHVLKIENALYKSDCGDPNSQFVLIVALTDADSAISDSSSKSNSEENWFAFLFRFVK